MTNRGYDPTKAPEDMSVHERRFWDGPPAKVPRTRVGMTATQTARYYERKLKQLGAPDSTLLKGDKARDYLGLADFKGVVLLNEFSDCCGLHQFIDGCATSPSPLIATPIGGVFHEYQYSYAVIFYDEELPDAEIWGDWGQN